MAIKIENIVPPSAEQWMAVIRGMRNPMNSWAKSDSEWDVIEDPSPINPDDMVYIKIGDADLALMQKLAKAGSDHRKFLRMMPVMMDVTAPLYWWKEEDTYKVGTVANSCSTMHKIADRAFTLRDFSCEHLDEAGLGILQNVIFALNDEREAYLRTNNKDQWWSMIQLLPSSYNQRRTLFLNYEVIWNIYRARKNHKLDEWRDFCKTIVEEVPYFKEIFDIVETGD